MKRWALVVVLLYGLLLVVLTLPVLMLAFAEEGPPTISDIRDIGTSWLYWATIGVLMLVQAALLLTPVRLASRRPVGRRSIFLLVAASGLLTGLLVLGAWVSISELILKKADVIAPLWALGCAGATWGIWAAVFYRMSRDEEPVDAVTRQCRVLFAGSVLELLVAVPTHVVARMRNYCCAGFGTFVGIAAGLAVMLMAFGPGIFFLFSGRWRQIRKGRPPLIPAFSLRTTVLAQLLAACLIGLILTLPKLAAESWWQFLMTPGPWLALVLGVAFAWSVASDRRRLREARASPDAGGDGDAP